MLDHVTILHVLVVLEHSISVYINAAHLAFSQSFQSPSIILLNIHKDCQSRKFGANYCSVTYRPVHAAYCAWLKCMFLFKELTPRLVGEAFYNGEFENELKRVGTIDWRIFKDSDRESYMAMIEEMRRWSTFIPTKCVQRNANRKI